jgi:hypothetical protein
MRQYYSYYALQCAPRGAPHANEVAAAGGTPARTENWPFVRDEEIHPRLIQTDG